MFLEANQWPDGRVETKREDLMKNKITDNYHHLSAPILFPAWSSTESSLTSIRNHGGVPNIEEDAFILEIGGLVNKPVALSLRDLQDPEKFPYIIILLNVVHCVLISPGLQSERGHRHDPM